MLQYFTSVDLKEVSTEVSSYEMCKFAEYLMQQFIESSSIEASAGLLAEVNDKTSYTLPVKCVILTSTSAFFVEPCGPVISLA